MNPAKPPHFLDVYRALFDKGIDSVIELGVHKGASLRFWHSLGAKRITGIDTSLDMLTGPVPGTCDVIEGDASDPDLLAGLEPADLVVDDASHRWDHQQASFAALWPKARKAYAIEDIDTSYSNDETWARGRSTADWLGDRLRDLHTGAADYARMTFYPGLVVFER